MRLILASASPRRAELLAAAGFAFDVQATDVDERVLPGEPPHDYVRRLAVEKSAAVLAALTGACGGQQGDGLEPGPTHDAPDGVLIIGADTAVIVDDEILGKPVDDLDAERMLRRLSGRSHRVLTGVSVRTVERQFDAVDETVVLVQALSEADVAWYMASGEGRDKAGAYAIQGLASRFIPRIEGSYTNVVGLPVALVSALLAKATRQ